MSDTPKDGQPRATYPAAIRRLIADADQIEASGGSVAAVFAMRWIAWEAARTRALLVVIRLRGWRLRDGALAFQNLPLSSSALFLRYFRNLAGRNFDRQLRGSADRAWTALKRIEQVRHRHFHGLESFADDYLNDCSIVLQKVLHHQPLVFGEVEVEDAQGKARRIGDVLRNRPGNGVPLRDASVHDLIRVLDGSPLPKQPPRPSKRDFERWASLFEVEMERAARRKKRKNKKK